MSMYCGFVLSVSIHQSSIDVIPSCTGDAVIFLTVEGFFLLSIKQFRSASFWVAQTFKILAVSSFEMVSVERQSARV